MHQTKKFKISAKSRPEQGYSKFEHRHDSNKVFEIRASPWL